MSATLVGWATGVNQEILNETNGTVGEGAVTVHQRETGGSSSILNSSSVPEQFAVTMLFDNDPLNEDANGRTEYERFVLWFERISKYGTIPFEFPVLTHSDPTQTTAGMARYKIPEGKFSWSANGCYVKVTMKWEQVFYKAFIIKNYEPEMLTSLICSNGNIEVNFSSNMTINPTFEQFTIEIKKDSKQSEIITLSGLYMLNEGLSTVFKFDKFSQNGTYFVTVKFNGKVSTGSFVVGG